MPQILNHGVTNFLREFIRQGVQLPMGVTLPRAYGRGSLAQHCDELALLGAPQIFHDCYKRFELFVGCNLALLGGWKFLVEGFGRKLSPPRPIRGVNQHVACVLA